MMNFSGSGSFRVGASGSLSSSSLSPLAPPFKVDKSAQKLNSGNPSVKYPDVPMYGPYFDHTGQFWNPSSSAASGQNLVTESMGINTTCSSSPGIYGYPVSQPSSTATGAYHVDSGAADAYDPFPYDPFSNKMSTSAVNGDSGKPFCSPYVPSAPQKDGYLSLGVGSGHGYDLLSNSSSGHVSGCGSSQVGHSQVRSGNGDGELNWGRIWGGRNEIEQDKWPGYAQGFGSKDLSLPDLSSNKSPFLFDGGNKSQPSTDVNTHPFTDGSSNIRFPGDGGNRNLLKQDGSFDIFGGTYHLGSLGINQQDNMSKLDCSRKPASAPVSISKESCGIPEVLEPVADVCGSQKANASSPGDHFSQSGFYVFGCSSTTSTNPATMTKSPFGDSSSFAESTLSALKLNSRRNVAANKSGGSAGYDSFCPFETHMSVGWKQKPSVIIRRPVSSVVPSSSKLGERADSQVKGKDASEKIQVTCGRTRQFSSDGFNLEDDDSEASFSVEKSSGGTDIHNPAEDSPCWRGASKQFSPFELSEDIAPDAPVKNLVECKSLRPHEPEIKSLVVDTFDSRDFFSKKAIQSKDDEEKSSTMQNPLRVDLNTGGGLQFGYNTGLSTKESCTSNKSKTVSDPSVFLDTRSLCGHVEKSRSSAMSDITASEGIENCPPVVTEKSSGIPSGIENKCANSMLGDDNIAKHCQSSKITDANTDVNVLVRTMTKLSEIFRCYCFNNQAGVPEQHIIAIKHIIANLNASLLMMVGETTPNVVSPQGNSLKELPNAQTVNNAETIADAAKLVRTAEGLLDFVSVKEDSIEDADMTEASKKILDVNLEEGEEEMNQQKILYKSLWLEAEASLCAMTAKARFLRLKAKMERTSGGAKENQGTVGLATMEKDSSMSSDCQNPNAVDQNHSVIPEAKKCDIPNTQVDINSRKFEGPKARKEDVFSPSTDTSGPGNTDNVLDGSGTTSHAADVEASVMTRYQILRTRVENSDDRSSDSEQPSGGYNNSSSFCPPAYDSHGTEGICELKGAEIPVLARYQIIMNRAENSKGPSCEFEPPSGGYNDSSSFCPLGYDSHGTERICELKGAEIPVMARYLILKDQIDHDSLSDERSQSLGEDNYLPERESSSPKYQILECGVDNSDSVYKGRDSFTADERFQNPQSLSNSVGVPEDGEASVMARFRIIQSRINHSNSVNKDQTPDQTYRELVGSGSDGVGFSKQQSNVSRYTFGPYPDLAEVEGVDQFGFCVDAGALLTQHCKTNRLSPEIFESWYDNDCFSSDWEHVSKDDLQKQS